MLLRCCNLCKHQIVVGDGDIIQGKCEKENQFVQHTNCIRKKALEAFIQMYRMDGPVGLDGGSNE